MNKMPPTVGFVTHTASQVFEAYKSSGSSCTVYPDTDGKYVVFTGMDMMLYACVKTDLHKQIALVIDIPIVFDQTGVPIVDIVKLPLGRYVRQPIKTDLEIDSFKLNRRTMTKIMMYNAKGISRFLKENPKVKKVKPLKFRKACISILDIKRAKNPEKIKERRGEV